MTGMTTQVFFIFGKAENAVIVPAEVLTRRAPREDNEKGKAYRVAVEPESRPRTARYSRRPADAHPGRSDRRLKAGERILVNRPLARPIGTAAGQ